MDPIYSFFANIEAQPRLISSKGNHRDTEYCITCHRDESLMIAGAYGEVVFKIEITETEVIMSARGPNNSQLENVKLAKKAYTQMGIDRNVQTFCTKVGAHARMLKKAQVK